MAPLVDQFGLAGKSATLTSGASVGACVDGVDGALIGAAEPVVSVPFVTVLPAVGLGEADAAELDSAAVGADAGGDQRRGLICARAGIGAWCLTR